jgi:CHAD domain-containing protein
MKSEQIKHITNSHYRKLKKYSKKIAEDSDVEEIREFRVEYKKLRAFFRMLSQRNEAGEEIKIAKELKSFYHVSGSIRDLQLQLQRIKEVTKQEAKKPSAYLALLQKEIKKLKPELTELFEKKPVSESKKKTDKAMPDKFFLRNYKDFIHQKWDTAGTIIKRGYFSDDNIHSIRKILKDLFYNLKAYRETDHDLPSSGIWKGKDEHYVHILLDQLGNFQDRSTAIALLKSYWINSLNSHEQVLLNRIKKTWLKEKRSMKNLLMTKLKKDIPRGRGSKN